VNDRVQRIWAQDGAAFVAAIDAGQSTEEIMSASGKTLAYIQTTIAFIRENPAMAPEATAKVIQATAPIAVSPIHWEDDERVRYGREFVKLHQGGKTLVEVAELRATTVKRVRQAMRAVEYDPERVSWESKPRSANLDRPAWTYPDARTLAECHRGREEIRQGDSRRTSR